MRDTGQHMGQPQGVAEDEVDLLQLLSTLYEGRFRILLITLAAIFLGVFYALIQKPVYQADALLQLEEKSGGGLAISADMAALFGQEPQIPAEIEILKSRSILTTVIENLALNISAAPKRLPVIGDFLRRYKLPDPGFEFLRPYAWHEEQIHVARLIVPRSLEGEELILTALGEGRLRLDLGGGRALEGEVGTLLVDEAAGIEILVDRLIGAPGRTFILQARPMVRNLEELRARFSVSEQGRNSSILRLVLKGPDADEAVRILDEISRVYLLQNIARSAAEAEASLKFIREQLPDAEASVKAAEEALNSFKEEQSSVDLTFEMRTLLEEAVQLEAQLNALTLEEYELQKRYTEQHPAYKTLLEKRSRLEERLADIRSQTSDLPQTQQDILRLAQDLEVAQQIYVQLLNRAQELSVLKAGTIGNVRIIDTAFTNGRAVAPRKSIIVVMAALLGIMAGAGLVLLRAFFSQGIRSPEEIENLGVPVYATIPLDEAALQNKSGHRKKSLPILARTDPTNLAVEALRSLRTSLHFGLIDSDTNVIQVTSSKPGEGKSFVSVNLAAVSAQSGQSVVLVDTDLRRGYLHKYFNLGRGQKGLSDILAGEASIEDVLIEDAETGLAFLPVGSYPPNPAELLMHPNFEKLLRELDKRFDLTILDTPPLLAVTDPVIIARFAAMILLVVRFQEVGTRELTAGIKTLERIGKKPTGSVLNGYDAKTSSYYSSYVYQYSYKTRD